MILSGEDEIASTDEPVEDLGIGICGYSIPKKGHEERENEDAFSYRLSNGILRVAVADGATESFYSRDWARLLVDEFVALDQEPKRETNGLGWIQTAALSFEQQHPLDNLPWHAQNKGALGSHATFAGLALDLQRRRYRTYQTGDSCLIIQGKKTRIVPKPFDLPLRFDSRPNTIASRRPYDLPYNFRSGSRDLTQETLTVWILTDALAEALSLGSTDDNAKAIKTLANIQSKEDFEALVHGLRSRHLIRNDDVTLVTVALQHAVDIQ